MPVYAIERFYGKEETTMTKLLRKMEAEMEFFLSDLKSKSAHEIIDSAYEITYKTEILQLFQSGEFDNVNKKALEKYAFELYKKEYPLDFLYQEWLKYDASVSDDLILFVLDNIHNNQYRDMTSSKKAVAFLREEIERQI